MQGVTRAVRAPFPGVFPCSTCSNNKSTAYLPIKSLLSSIVVKLGYKLPENENSVLLLDPPHDSCYRYYLQAMIDYENGEYNRYANTSQMFNAAWNDFVAWFAEKYRPADGYINPEDIL